MRECDDGFVVGDGSLWVHVMSVEYRNAIDKVAYTLFCMNCPGFGCLSRVRVVTDNFIIGGRFLDVKLISFYTKLSEIRLGTATSVMHIFIYAFDDLVCIFKNFTF